MMRIVGIVLLLALSLAGAALGNAVAPPAPAPGRPAALLEPLSRAQVAQAIADRGYFEMDGLRQGADGNWRCTALSGPERRVTITIDPYGHILEESGMHVSGQ